MYSKLPNLVLAFHGCDASTASKVISGKEKLKSSVNDYDWLGHGVYFWEQNLKRAKEWAREQQRRGAIDSPGVVGAVIDLGHCLNLMDSESISILKQEYLIMKREFQILGLELPENVGKTKDRLLRRLDCAVVQHLHARLKRGGNAPEGVALEPFDSVRALFSEGDEIYPDAGFKEKTHIQICIKNPNCIKGYFDPRTPSRSWPLP